MSLFVWKMCSFIIFKRNVCNKPVKVKNTASDKWHARVVVSFIRIYNDFNQRDKDFVNILYNVRPRLST